MRSDAAGGSNGSTGEAPGRVKMKGDKQWCDSGVTVVLRWFHGVEGRSVTVPGLSVKRFVSQCVNVSRYTEYEYYSSS